MKDPLTDILSLDSLKIGYVSGRAKQILLPPLDAIAKKGELIAVIGRNGIGKSTLLRTITGLQPSLGGLVMFGNRRIDEFSKLELALQIGYISTEIIKVSNMNVYELVALGRFPHTSWIGRIDTANHEMIMSALEMTGLLSFRNRFVSELSDGERQKAMIARILAQDTGIMIMDEPTAFLDIGSKYEILHLMHTLTRKRGKTIIFSTHDLHMAISQSDKIWLISDRSLKEGSPEDLMLEDAFGHLFDSSPVQFNSENGTFTFRSDECEAIYLNGDGTARYWTEKAIHRAGYSVSEAKTDPFISIPDAECKKWRVEGSTISIEFGTVYELVNYLSGEKIMAY
jgi:iron complex transport system ATP-binding protein